MSNVAENTPATALLQTEEASAMSKHNENAALQSRLEWHRATLASVGDAVIASDTEGRVTFLNPVAESLTGWTLAEAAGQALDSVFRLINEESRQPVKSPAVRVLREGTIVGLASHCLLIHKSGTERLRRQQRQVQAALTDAESAIATLRHPYTVLDQHLRVQSANGAFYRAFHVSKAETEGCLIYDLGNGQWNIPRLRTL